MMITKNSSNSTHYKSLARRWAAWALLGGVCLVAAGCGRNPSARDLSLDQDVARQSLETFLQTWKQGHPAEVLKESSPAIIGSDDAWQQGGKLVDFRLLDHEFNDGTNLHLAAELHLASGKRRMPIRSVVNYVVGTDPVVTVFRQ